MIASRFLFFEKSIKAFAIGGLLLLYFCIFPIYFWQAASNNLDMHQALVLPICLGHILVFVFILSKVIQYFKPPKVEIHQLERTEFRKKARAIAEELKWQVLMDTPKKFVFKAQPPPFHDKQMIYLTIDQKQICCEVHSFLTANQLSPFTFFADKATQKHFFSMLTQPIPKT